MTSAAALKREAAAHAVRAVTSGMTLGLGTGSTVAPFLELLAERIRDGELADVVGVPSSVWTREESRRLGIPLATLAERPHLEPVRPPEKSPQTPRDQPWPCASKWRRRRF